MSKKIPNPNLIIGIWILDIEIKVEVYFNCFAFFTF
ncbi:hypothetical protein EV143_109162 [Flavobacterium chryseum]|nr:hypothetical protein EV143_109162 [Flavobacterium sp. P3160]